MRVTAKVIEELKAQGNGARRTIPQPGGGDWVVSYLWGKVRVDILPTQLKLPEPGTGGGAANIAPT